MSKDDSGHALAALEHLAVLRSHAASDGADEALRFDAICMRLAAAIEDASRIGDEVRARAFGAKWPAMWSTRNRITHGYAFVSWDVVLATVERDLDDFEAALLAIAKSVESRPSTAAGPE
ncbi:HepT-like ribonuclease domain-containing protein [Demequina lutea]|uniref:Uncharacterized protein with HEPN domain n=1 Tax=Demequina lutea TaxID=431489 RepID=A0A7Y9ZAB2_9MICO|nr:HepT-like ribonuclease domain-containing protein [Demequina lutea]NYI41689.1 uncharacterized protein with HEPN domain [Demequina lutea]